MYGVSFVRRYNPLMVVWWSAAFPGYGQILLNQYLRGILLTLSEKIINTLAHVNEAIVYTFCGKFEMAASILDPRWAVGYLIVYLYCIWDSYRGTLEQNKLCHLAELENPPIRRMLISSSETQYLELKNPLTAALYSFFLPGLGQLYINRIVLGVYAMFWWWIYVSLSYAQKSFVYLIRGDISQSVSMLHPHWLLFMPSVLGGAVYHAVAASS